jgi:hypothetical protein
MRLSLLVVTLLASISLAQPAPNAEAKRLQPTHAVQTVDFTNPQAIGGLREGPVVSWEIVPEKTRFKSLIRLRASFANELANSVDAL